MANKEIIPLQLKADTKEAQKNLEQVSKQTKNISDETKGAIGNFQVMGVSINGIKGSISKVIPFIKTMFTSIKVGIASTGLGIFLVALGSLAQFFRDSEEGASKLKEITSALGVAFGNVTDIVSDTGKAVYNLLTGNLDGFKEAVKDATDGVLNFGENTRKEMGSAIQLEKDRLALQKFEREAIVDKAKTESEIMKLRLQARDREKFTNAERLEFMRQANALADEQLQKDLHVAEEKLRFQQVENSYSKSTQENLDAEAQLQAQVFQIQRSNFSERKRMKSEEQALASEAASIRKQEEAERLRVQAEELKAEEELGKKKLEINNQIALLQEESDKERELLKLEQDANKILALEEDAEMRRLIHEKLALDKQAINDKYNQIELDADKVKNEKKKAEDKAVADSKMAVGLQALNVMSDIVGRESAAGKALAVGQATMNTYQAATNALANTPAPPPFPQIAAALTVVSGLMQVKKIVATPPPKKMATGGMVRGIGTGTSDSVDARLSKGESVINAKSTRMFRPLLSAINQAGGGRGFANGGIVGGDAGGITTGVVKAFVVADEMTTEQDRLNNIRRKATI